MPLSVPGAVDGWFELHDRFGALPMAEVLAPAIEYARQGFPVTEVIAYYFQRNGEVLKDQPGFAEVFIKDGSMPQKGERFRNPDLANTYQMLAEQGRDAFYEGEIAETIGDFVQQHGGFLSDEDLAAHESTWVDPVSSSYRGYDLWELPPNTQGIAAQQILNILENFDVAEMGFDSPEYVPHFVEAKKLAFEDRAKYYSDPAFNEIPVEGLLDKGYAKQRAKLIDPNKPAATG